MILPDLNLLLYAYNSEASAHDKARAWWEGLMEGGRPVGLAWVVILGFVRISTHRKIFENPWPVARACGIARSWLARPQVTVLHPGERHAEILFSLLEDLGSAANLTTDAHLATLAIEYQAVLHTTDADFSRFSGLKHVNPLEVTRRGH